MTVLLDDGDHADPSFRNITEAFKKLSEESQPGDAVFVQFSGHGGRVLDSPESYDEIIAPSDYTTSGLIRDTLIFKTLLAPMRYGVTVTILIDTCDTGMVVDLPYMWSTKGDRRDSVAKLGLNEDFSFVRFLRVIKTLYEASTFTQLGRTVGTALEPSERVRGFRQRDDGITDGEATQDARNADKSLFDTIAEACITGKDQVNCNEDVLLQSKSGNTVEGSPSKSGDKSSKSLLSQVMNCTLMTKEEEYFSDEDTFQTRTDEERSFEELGGDSLQSYGASLTEDDIESRKAARRSRKNRKR